MKPIDATRLGVGANLAADVAVVGAGPAGIVLALELAEAGLEVLLIESGGDSFNAAAQRLADTVGEDPPHVSSSLSTRRQIGGATNLWAGRCVPFDPVDFQPRAIAGEARWPVAYEELRSYFPRACEWLVCGAPVFDASAIPGLADSSLIPGWPGGEVGATALERWSLPTNFRTRYGARLRATPGLTLVTGLTCTEIVCQRHGAGVDHLVGRTLDGGQARVRALSYVLACGGLESTRLLFASDSQHPGGIGNHSGHLGHWYMAHVESRIANVRFATPPGATIYDFERDPDGVYVRRRFTFSPDFAAAHELPNAALWLLNPALGDVTHRSGILSLMYLLLASPLGPRLTAEGIRLRQLETTRPASLRAHLANVARELFSTVAFAGAFGYEHFLKAGHKAPGVYVPSPANVYVLNYHGEHLPHHASRVVPTSRRDALGVPRLRTHLRLADSDIHGVQRTLACFDEYLLHHRLGRLEYLYPRDPEVAIRRQFFGGYHQAGTTRMSAHPDEGVLDRDLAVHGFEDLFVASSSAFVTSSQANTTFMIVVFALRLADRLRCMLGR